MYRWLRTTSWRWKGRSHSHTDGRVVERFGFKRPRSPELAQLRDHIETCIFTVNKRTHLIKGTRGERDSESSSTTQPGQLCEHEIHDEREKIYEEMVRRGGDMPRPESRLRLLSKVGETIWVTTDQSWTSNGQGSRHFKQLRGTPHSNYRHTYGHCCKNASKGSNVSQVTRTF